MREFGTIHTKFWFSPDMRELDDSSKLLASYLLTSPHSNGLGCYRLPFGYLLSDLGWDKKRAEASLKKLEEIKFAVYDPRLEWVLLPKFLAYNPVQNAKHGMRIHTLFREVPVEVSFYGYLIASILYCINTLSTTFKQELDTLSIRYPYPIDTVAIPYRYTDTDTDTDTDTERDTRPPDGDPSPDESVENCPYGKIIEEYHKSCPELQLIQALTDKRKRKIRALWQKHPDLDYWREVFENAGKSEFLAGKNDRGWRADLLWIFDKEENHLKILEGKFSNNTRAQPLLTHLLTDPDSPEFKAKYGG